MNRQVFHRERERLPFAQVRVSESLTFHREAISGINPIVEEPDSEPEAGEPPLAERELPKPLEDVQTAATEMLSSPRAALPPLATIASVNPMLPQPKLAILPQPVGPSPPALTTAFPSSNSKLKFE
jgi:hypothetical protein